MGFIIKTRQPHCNDIKNTNASSTSTDAVKKTDEKKPRSSNKAFVLRT